MQKMLVKALKTMGEKTAKIPVVMRCWPGKFNQPKMPKALRDKMMSK